MCHHYYQLLVTSSLFPGWKVLIYLISAYMEYALIILVTFVCTFHNSALANLKE